MPRQAEGESAKRATTKSGSRYWEVDAARGVAILMMVVYHFTYDLYAFGGYDVDAVSGFWARFADSTASLFLLLVGVSLAITAARGDGGFRPYLLRGLRILVYGMLLTAVFLVFGMGIVAFGILHLIGVSIILAYPFLKLKLTNLVLGVAVFAVGLYVQAGDPTGSPWLLPLGVVPEGWAMPDYRPLLPWFGVVLIGLFIGNVVYGKGRPARFPARSPVVARPLLPLGRNSLAIYLVHQPLLVALLTALGVVDLNLF
ncbi:DUF1624 domain-containing protein [Rubrobacter tropicus]|uniref:DUF1624 domain-containing protein n=2 Tax=Rubrobacter tropicus TaxID=2653851 RepID=A0A6G8QF72_9ACTN|nr:DUF1624 domain-containing protein [Rubrobacter tropicus]